MMIKKAIKALQRKIQNKNSLNNALKQLRDWEAKDMANPNALPILDRMHWQQKLKNMVKCLSHSNDLSGFSKAMLTIEAFYQSHIECLRPFPEPPNVDAVILVTAVKNNRTRLEHFLKHYRKMGVKNFAFIDNGSTDGTVEAILAQKDTACFKVSIQFTSERKTAWFNRVAAYYDAERWFIMVDSDELLAYPRMSQFSIQQYTKILQEKGIDFIKTLMVDMYPDRPLMDDSMTDEEYLDACIYFDSADSYKQVKNESLRRRLFLDKKAEKLNLNKPSLFRFSNYFLLSSHYVFPKSANDVPHGAVVLHYKFLPSDRQNYIRIVKEGAYYEGDLKLYDSINKKIENTPYINPMCELSVPFDGDDAWRFLPFVVNYTEWT